MGLPGLAGLWHTPFTTLVLASFLPLCFFGRHSIFFFLQAAAILSRRRFSFPGFSLKLALFRVRIAKIGRTPTGQAGSRTAFFGGFPSSFFFFFYKPQYHERQISGGLLVWNFLSSLSPHPLSFLHFRRGREVLGRLAEKKSWTLLV